MQIGNGTFTSCVVIVPYLSIVIPLTLLSAWLLLSTPRQPKPVAAAPETA